MKTLKVFNRPTPSAAPQAPALAGGKRKAPAVPSYDEEAAAARREAKKPRLAPHAPPPKVVDSEEEEDNDEDFDEEGDFDSASDDAGSEEGSDAAGSFDDDEEDDGSDEEDDEDEDEEGSEDDDEEDAEESDEEEEEEEEEKAPVRMAPKKTAPAPAPAAPAAAAAAGPAPTFESLGVCEPLCRAASLLGWTGPTRIQQEAIPVALAGKDIVAIAETGSGKTGSFALPILQDLLSSPAYIFACVLAPTRELAFQIADQFNALGSAIQLKTAVLVGGVDIMTQAIALARKPHIIVGTPGRVVEHLEKTKGFSLKSIKYLVLDEADRMLSLDFEEAINKILGDLAATAARRRTFLFSATLSTKLENLQRASLRDPVRVEVSHKYATVQTLIQQYVFLPAKLKEAYLAYVLNEFAGQSGYVFVATCASAQKITLALQNLGFSVTCLHGQMPQPKRLAALAKFKAGQKSILVATDVASRGLDIPSVDLVLNYDVPSNGKDYVHRVGRTARAGRSGRAITLVTQYDIELYQRVEHLLGTKLEAFPVDEEAVAVLAPRVSEAVRLAGVQIREDEAAAREMGLSAGGGRSRGGGAGEGADDNDDANAAALLENSAAMRRAMGAAVRSKAKGMGGRGGGGGFGGRGGGRGGGGHKFRR